MAGVLSGCQSVAPACPVGQEHVRTAQLFLGRQNVGPPAKPADLQRFIDREITPRFPEGVTVVKGGAQWKASGEAGLVREATKIVLIVLPPKGDADGKLDAVRKAYRTQFQQESVLVVTQPACVAL